MRRARSDQDKQERRRAILTTAWRMYTRDPSFAGFTMDALAKEAGVAKGTLYLYFRTKEELFLTLLESGFDAWFDVIDARLDEGGDAELTPDDAAQVVVRSIRGREALARLLSILPTIVEHNVEYDAALRFKRQVMRRADVTGHRLEARLPFLRAGEGARFLVHLHALVIGVWQLAEPSPVIRRVMETPELAPARVDFEEDLRFLLVTLLAGMRTAAAERAES
ncbi:MAG: TetR family transcriptional regulator [Gemmatimonadetes bacterium]|nr:TetR family transcriptional regulator [Gemmatimonadota bacterium]